MVGSAPQYLFSYCETVACGNSADLQPRQRPPECDLSGNATGTARILRLCCPSRLLWSVHWPVPIRSSEMMADSNAFALGGLIVFAISGTADRPISAY